MLEPQPRQQPAPRRRGGSVPVRILSCGQCRVFTTSAGTWYFTPPRDRYPRQTIEALVIGRDSHCLLRRVDAAYLYLGFLCSR